MSRRPKHPPWETDPDYNDRQDREDRVRYAAEEEARLSSPESMRERLDQLESQVTKLIAIVKLQAENTAVLVKEVKTLRGPDCIR